MEQRNLKPVSYVCSVCNRTASFHTSSVGINVTNGCAITAGCPGTMRPMSKSEKIYTKPSLDIAPITNEWYQRRILSKVTQPNSRNVWVCEHNLGSVPTVEVYVYDSSDNLVPYDGEFIVNVDNINTVRIAFASSYSGVAVFQAKSSPLAQQTNEKLIQTRSEITFNSIITLAFREKDAVSSLSIKFGDYVVTYPSLPFPQFDYPWGGVKRVFINNVAYTISSFNFELHGNAAPIFLSKTIKIGDTVSFIFPPSVSDAYILMSSAPYEYSDRVTDKIVNFTKLSNKSPYYDGANIVVDSSAIQPTFPPISF